MKSKKFGSLRSAQIEAQKLKKRGQYVHSIRENHIVATGAIYYTIESCKDSLPEIHRYFGKRGVISRMSKILDESTVEELMAVEGISSLEKVLEEKEA